MEDETYVKLRTITSHNIFTTQLKLISNSLMSASTLNGLLQEAVTYANSSKYRKSSDKYKELYQMTAIDVVPLNQNHIGYPLRYHSLSGKAGG